MRWPSPLQLLMAQAVIGFSTIFYVAHSGPVTHEVVTTQVVKRVEKVERIVIPKPSSVKYAPLDDPKKACHGAPVVITNIFAAGWQGQSKDDTGVNTWLTVRPAGDEYTVQCYLGGDNTSSWHVGDIISLPAGNLAGAN